MLPKTALEHLGGASWRGDLETVRATALLKRDGLQKLFLTRFDMCLGLSTLILSLEYQSTCPLNFGESLHKQHWAFNSVLVLVRTCKTLEN